jgi:hypothetical protein
LLPSSLRTNGQWSSAIKKSDNTPATSAQPPSSVFEDERIVEKTLDLTPEQQQLLEQENNELAQGLESTLDQVR